MTTLLAGIAEFERSLIKARTDVGIKRAELNLRMCRPGPQGSGDALRNERWTLFGQAEGFDGWIGRLVALLFFGMG